VGTIQVRSDDSYNLYDDTSKYNIAEIIQMSLKQGLTVDDVAHLQMIKDAEEAWETKVRDAEGDSSPPANSVNQLNKHKNQDKDSEKILSIYDSKHYCVPSEKEFLRLNPYASSKSYKMYELFVQYCIWADNIQLSSDELNAYNNIVDDIKSKIKLKYKGVISARAENYCTNKYNVFILLIGASMYSFEYGDFQLDMRLSREYLNMPTHKAILKLRQESPQFNSLYNLKSV